MTVQAPTTTSSSRNTAGDIALDGLFTGMIGALIVALWFLVLDVSSGRAFYTPALLGTVLLHGATAAAQGVIVAPLEIAAYTAFHFMAFLAVGLGLSYLMTLFEKAPIVGFVLLVLFLCLQLGFFCLDAVLGAQLMGRLQPWSVVMSNVLASSAMTIYLWKRHPKIKQSLDHLWDKD